MAFIILIIIFFLLHSPHRFESLKTMKTTINQALILPLKTQTLSPPFPLRSPHKLLFHHNTSLTVSLSVGTPPQIVAMVLDTGSEISWLLCNSAAAGFHPHSSSTFSSIPCSSPSCHSYLPCNASSHCLVSLSYADASTSEGFLAADIIHSKLAVFACITAFSSPSPSDPSVAGLLGMNQGPLSFITQSSIRRFSYCIPTACNASGVLLLGESGIDFHLNYTPMLKLSLPLPYFDRAAYSVKLDGILVDGSMLPIPKSILAPDHTGAGQTIVDSGTQFTFLLGPAYAALKREFMRRSKGVMTELTEPEFRFQGALDACFRLPAWRKDPPEGIPTVSLVFPGAEIVVGSDLLLYRVPGERRGGDAVWCLTFGNADLVPVEAYVIGHHHQRELWVEYDLDRGLIGFGPARCELVGKQLGFGL